jgi:High potential iron-sulfur protein
MESHDQQRRIILRSALAAGCTLAVPSLFAGCGKKEGPPSPEPSPETGGGGPSPVPPETGPSGASPKADGSGRVSKEQAKYQEQPNGDHKCSNCQQFVAESSACKVVEGEISPKGWCTLWVKKA